MISSMTGFGRGQATADGYETTVEIRSVNSRFCEVSVRGPRELNEHEPAIQRIIKGALSRGRVTVNIQLEQSREGSIGLSVDENAVRAYRDLLQQISKTAALPDEPITLDQLLRFQDILVSDKGPDQESNTWTSLSAALNDAIAALKAMRRTEGDALANELEMRGQSIAARLQEVKQLAPLRIPAAKTRIRERLDELIQEGRIDPDRLEQEMAFLADKLDVTEECVRLDAHLEAYHDALASSDPVGRKLNFLAQEINREVNTIGSKANDAEIAQVVVGMKEDLEKIREQIENVE